MRSRTSLVLDPILVGAAECLVGHDNDSVVRIPC